MIRRTLFCALLALSSAFGGNILIHDDPWEAGFSYDDVMGQVFPGNFSYTTYAGADAANIFSSSNAFVWMDGGAGTDATMSSFLQANSALITSWVNGGGALLLQSAGLSQDVSFGPVTLEWDIFNYCGSPTAALPGASPACAFYLSHNVVSGPGLTTYVVGDHALPIVSGARVGSGFIMYSGLTAPYWHDDGGALTRNIVEFTAAQAAVATPEPGSVVLLSAGLSGILFLRRRSRG